MAASLSRMAGSPLKGRPARTHDHSSTHGFADGLRYQDKLLALYEHALGLTTARTLDEIVSYTLDAMEYALAFDFAYVGIVQNDLITIISARGTIPRVTHLPLNGRGITVKAATSKKTVNVSDTRLDTAYVDQMGFDWEETPTMLSELAVPTIVDDNVVAVLNVESQDPNAFDGEDEILLEMLSVLVSTHLKRIRNLQALQISENRFKTLVDHLPVGVYETDINGRILEGNPTLATILGYKDASKLTSLNLSTFFRNRLSRGDHLSKLAIGVADTAEFELLPNDGRPIWVREDTIALQGADGRIKYHGTLLDITEKKLLREQLQRYSKQLETLVAQKTSSLRESQERLAAIIHASPESITVTDLDGTIIDCNQATVEMHGFASRDELVGKNIRLLIAEKDHEIAIVNTMRTLEEGVIKEIGYTCVTRAGREFPAEYSISVVRDAKGDPTAFVAVTKDLTEHIKLDNRLRKAERLAVIGETATMVAHDLRNPLQGLTGAAFLLKEKLQQSQDQDVDEAFALIDNCIQYSNKIVGDLLDYAREPQLELGKTTLRAIVAAALFQIALPPEVELTNHVSDEPALLVDKTRMQRVVINLVRNAIEAMPNGGRIIVVGRRDAQNAELTVSDTGPGIPEELKQRIWKPLNTTKAKGIGLGLAICKRFVEAHGGRIEALNERGKGATFKILLPINGPSHED